MDKNNDAFDSGFHNWMASAMAYDWYEKQRKPPPPEWKKRLEEGLSWVSGLSAGDYSRLIH